MTWHYWYYNRPEQVNVWFGLLTLKCYSFDRNSEKNTKSERWYWLENEITEINEN
jgi:hypothetical protein